LTFFGEKFKDFLEKFGEEKIFIGLGRGFVISTGNAESLDEPVHEFIHLQRRSENFESLVSRGKFRRI